MNDLALDLVRTAPLGGTVLTGLALVLLNAWKRDAERAQFALALAGLAASIALAVAAAPWNGTAFHRMMLTGGYASVSAVLVLGSALLAVALARPQLAKIGAPYGEYYILVVLAASGMLVFAAATDLIATFIGLEIMSIPLYVLAGFTRGNTRANEASLKYFLLGAFASGFVLYGIALLYGSAGTTNLADIARRLPSLAAQPLFLAGAGLLATGVAFKVGAAPFHLWVPDVYQGAPTAVTAFMASGAKGAAFCAIAMLFMLTLDAAATPLRDAFAILAAASMIVGNVAALAQRNVKRMLAYSSIGHAGYMLIAVATSGADALAGLLFYVASYALTTLGAFGIVAMVERGTQTGTDVDDFRGLGRRHPLPAALLSLFLFSLIGLPPFSGFFGKYYVFYAAVEGGMTWLVVVGIATSMLALAYYLRVMVAMYFEEAPDADATGASASAASEDPGITADAVSLLALAVCTAGVLLFGVLPGLLLDAVSILRLAL